jgi:hypothetical protein
MARANSNGKWRVSSPPIQDTHPTVLQTVETQHGPSPGSIRTRLEAVIEAERQNLARAQSVASCLAIALHAHPEQHESTPRYAQVAEVIRDLVNRSLERLDCINLARAMAE